jgi:hypothetical protein
MSSYVAPSAGSGDPRWIDAEAANKPNQSAQPSPARPATPVKEGEMGGRRVRVALSVLACVGCSGFAAFVIAFGITSTWWHPNEALTMATTPSAASEDPAACQFLGAKVKTVEAHHKSIVSSGTDQVVDFQTFPESMISTLLDRTSHINISKKFQSPMRARENPKPVPCSRRHGILSARFGLEMGCGGRDSIFDR